MASERPHRKAEPQVAYPTGAHRVAQHDSPGFYQRRLLRQPQAHPPKRR